MVAFILKYWWVFLIVLIGGLGIWAYYSHQFSALMEKLFKTKPKQPVILPGEDRVLRMLDFNIEESNYIADQELTGAWHLVNSLGTKMQGLRRRILLLSTRDTFPINPHIALKYAQKKRLEDISAIAREGFYRAEERAMKESRNHFIAMALTICVCLIVVVVLIFASISLYKNGARLPFL